jgi:hypothetical protein
LYVREQRWWKRLRCLWAAFVIVDRMSYSACIGFCRFIASLLECIVKDLVGIGLWIVMDPRKEADE